MTTLNVVGVVVTKTGVKVFLDDGSDKSLTATDYRAAEIIDKVTMGLMKGGMGAVVQVDLEEFVLAKKVEEATNGAVKVETNGVETTLETKTGAKIVVEGDALDTMLTHAAQGDGAKGLAAFIEDFAKMKRSHSQKELLDFAAKHRMPIADDGSLIVFKRLTTAYRNGEKDGEYMVDTRTQKVRQRVGSIVRMPDSRVDPNRANECSSGFHVAAEHYIGSFYGDRVIVCKIRPRHVVAVPRDYNFSKMRVSQYFIVGELTGDLKEEVIRNKGFNASDAGAKYLGRIVAGQHTKPIELVEENRPGVTEVTPIEKLPELLLEYKNQSEVTEVAPVRSKKEKQKVKPIKPVNTKKQKAAAAPVSPKDVRAKIKTAQGAKTAKDKAAEYAAKFKEAKKLWKKGKGLSFRAIADELGMDRNVLAEKLKASLIK
jgi:hypothetical protein